MEKFEKLIIRFSRYLNWIAGIGLILMTAMAVGDIIGNKLFKFPLPGGIEMVGFLAVIITAFSMAEMQIIHGHIEVHFITERFPKKVKGIIYSFIWICLLVLWAVITWRSIDYGHVLQTTGEVSMTERIPFYPFVYSIAFCSFFTLLVVFIQLVKEIKGLRQ